MAGVPEQRKIIGGWDTSLDPTTAPTRVLMSAKDYWAKMTPEQRSAEMKRRRAIRANGKATKKVVKGKRKVTKSRPKIKRDSNKVPTRTNHNRVNKEANNGRNRKKEEDLTPHVTYLFGKVETIIEYYANSNRLSKQTLADGVAELLRH